MQRKTPSAIHLEDGTAQLLRADEQIIRHCVAPEEGLAVIRRVGLREMCIRDRWKRDGNAVSPGKIR